MRIKRTLSIIRVFFIIALLVFSCSSSAYARAATDPRNTITKATQNCSKLHSFHMSLDINSSFCLKGENISVVIKDEYDIQVKPMLGKGIMHVIVDTGLKKFEKQVTQYIEEAGDQFVAYSNDDKRWVKQSIPYIFPFINPCKNSHIEAITNVIPISEDASTAVFEVTISGSALQESFKRQMAMADMEKMKLPDNPLKDVGDLKYTVTIDKKAAVISKANIDLSGFVAKIADNIIDSMEMPNDKKVAIKEIFNSLEIVVNVSFSKFNSVEKITIPDEAKNAVPIALPQAILPRNSLESKPIGIVNTTKIMMESTVVKASQETLNEKGRELADQLKQEAPALTQEQFKQRQIAYYQEFLALKQKLEGQINNSIEKATYQVAKEKNLTSIKWVTSDNDVSPINGVDITEDVIDRMQMIN